jgi:hypothetical protein
MMASTATTEGQKRKDTGNENQREKKKKKKNDNRIDNNSQEDRYKQEQKLLPSTTTDRKAIPTVSASKAKEVGQLSNNDKDSKYQRKRKWGRDATDIGETESRKRINVFNPSDDENSRNWSTLNGMAVTILGKEERKLVGTLVLVEYSHQLDPSSKAYALIPIQEFVGNEAQNFIESPNVPNALSKNSQRCRHDGTGPNTSNCVLQGIAFRSPYGVCIGPLEWKLIENHENASLTLIKKLMSEIRVQIKWYDGVVTWENVEHFYEHAKNFWSIAQDNEVKYRYIKRRARAKELEKWL